MWGFAMLCVSMHRYIFYFIMQLVFVNWGQMLFSSIVKLLVYPSRLVIQCCWPSSCMLLVNGSSLSIQISQQFITMKFTLLFLLQFLCLVAKEDAPCAASNQEVLVSICKKRWVIARFSYKRLYSIKKALLSQMWVCNISLSISDAKKLFACLLT